MTRLLLAGLAAADGARAIVALAFPELWFRLVHGALYLDPQALLRRAGAAWIALAILEAVALTRSAREPGWLAAVAGARCAEVLSDWMYLALADRVTEGATVYLAVAPLANFAAALALAAAYRASRPPPVR